MLTTQLVEKNFFYSPVRCLAITALVLLFLPVVIVAQPLFAPAVNYAAGDHPHGLAVGDLDGDGDQDLITANANANTIAVLMNDGNGTFANRVTYTGFVNPTGVCVADFDLDGDLDVAVANHAGGFVRVFKNDGSGSLVFWANYTTAAGCHFVLASDLDGDGDVDLVTGNRADNSTPTLGTISVLENDGTGVFGNIVNYPTTNLPHKIFVADLDADGDKDIVVTNLGVFPLPFTSETISVFVNNGDTSLTGSTFAVKFDYPTGFGPSDVVAFDCDSDGDLDLAVANTSSNSLSLLKNNGESAFTDSTFTSRVDYVVGAFPAGVCAADLNGDGHSDLAVTNIGSLSFSGNTISFLKNDGDGTFAGTVNYTTGTGPYPVIAVDLDGDGDLDLATSNLAGDNVSILKNLTIPAVPPLLSPQNGSIRQPLSPTLHWNSSLGTQTYRLQVSSDSLFATTVFDDSTLVGTSHQVGSLADSVTYYWRVNAKNIGTSGWSSVWRFMTTRFTLTPRTLSFGDVLVGSSKPDSVTVTNTGLIMLNVSLVASDNANFTVTPDTVDIAPSDNQRFYISFSPASVGVKSGNIIFTHNAAGSPDTMKVQGTGVVPIFSIVPTTVQYGYVSVDSTKKDSITVANIGTATLTISSVTSDNAEFTVTPSSASLAPSTNKKFYITFAPTSGGTKSGIIAFTHNAVTSPDTLRVVGRGGIPTSVQISMRNGWNLVSIPVIVSDYRKDTLFRISVSSAFAYEGSYELKDTLSNHIGYWLKFGSAQNDTINGFTITEDTFDVVEGWNLIGSISFPVATTTISSIDSGLVTSEYFGYNGVYFHADTIQPGKGYWVKVDSAGKLILSASPSAELASWNRITIVRSEEMPPPPPERSQPTGGAGIPTAFVLEQNYPNPFNPQTTIRFGLLHGGPVTLSMYNILGQEVARLVDGWKEAGYYSIMFDAGILPSGIYYYKLTTSEFADVKQMMLVK